ncbi:leucine/isoleucine/valine transporter ATP-binding subunit [compost metagenome]
MVLIEHDMGMVMSISDHIVVLDHGNVIAEGAPQEIRNNPTVIAAYLGADEEELV